MLSRLTLTAMMEMQAPWSLKAKYTPFLVTFTAFVSVLITTSLLALNLPSPAAIRPVTHHVIINKYFKTESYSLAIEIYIDVYNK